MGLRVKRCILAVAFMVSCSRTTMHDKSSDPRWNAVQPGMTISQVEQVMGSPGTLAGTLGDPSNTVELREWVSADGKKLIAAFQRGKLLQKTQ